VSAQQVLLLVWQLLLVVLPLVCHAVLVLLPQCRCHRHCCDRQTGTTPARRLPPLLVHQLGHQQQLQAVEAALLLPAVLVAPLPLQAPEPQLLRTAHPTGRRRRPCWPQLGCFRGCCLHRCRR
jgi:hypothetical protein